MTASGSPVGRDRQLRGLIQSARGEELRVVAVSAPQAAEEAHRRHQTNAVATILLGRSLLAGSLLATLTKSTLPHSAKTGQGPERVTLQLTGDGPIKAIIVDADSHGDLRGYPAVPAPGNGAGSRLGAGIDRPRVGWALGQRGYVNVVRDLGLRDFYRGQALVESGEVDRDVQAYLCISEQIPSTVGLEVRLDEAGGVAEAVGLLFQSMPRSSAELGEDGDPSRLEGSLAVLEQRLGQGQLWRALVALRQARRPLDLEELLVELCGDLGRITLLEEHGVRFRCRCTRERVLAALAVLGADDLRALEKEQGGAEVSCQFCSELYRLDGPELRELADQTATAGARADLTDAQPTGPDDDDGSADRGN